MGKETLMEAVRDLRKHLGLTQTQFGAKLGYALPTVQRWEKVVPPRGKALAALYKEAVNSGLHQVATKFHQALTIEFGAAASYRLGEIEEALIFIIRDLKYGDKKAMKQRLLKRAEAALRTVQEINPFTTAPQDNQEKGEAQ